MPNARTTRRTVHVTDPHTNQRWTYPQRSRSEARRLALRLRRAGYVATYGAEVSR